MTNGWEDSAAAWIADMGEHGDFGRRYVLDPVMLERVEASGARNALDVGCGEGRFCRMLRAKGLDIVGLEPTEALLTRARDLDPNGQYVEGEGEALPFADSAFDLVISYLSLIDIPNLPAAIPEMARVLKPGGAFLIANLNGFNTAASELGWIRDAQGETRYALDHYLDEREVWVEWRGIRIINHHRPLSRYMQLLLNQHLRLTYFAEPEPTSDAPSGRAVRYRRAPWFMVMEWRKPA